MGGVERRDGQCGLWGAMGSLRQSHVIPKFVFEWLRIHRSGLRDLGTPSLPKQDAPKPRLFCASCEGLFGSWERDVAERIFRPSHGAERVRSHTVRGC